MTSTAKTAIAGAVILMAMTGRATAQSPVLIGFDDGEAELVIRRAVEGAGARLARPGCRELLSDFTDDTGERLETRLLASGRSPAQGLARLRFFDDRTAPHCRAGTAMAFTHPGSQVIRVCGREFRKRNREAAEIILIHEFLHVLGLGENPPTSDEITERVAARCGGR
ncbi:MAG TPA: hypothetical protein VIX63_07555 [Vicinamibacterales bacterium]